MFILEVSYGCPSERYPLNGVFQLDQAKALAAAGHQVAFAALDTRSIRRWRKWGLSEHERPGFPVLEYNVPIGPGLPNLRQRLCAAAFARMLDAVSARWGKPALVHVHFAETARCVAAVCRRAGIPYVVTEHSSAVNRDDLSEAEIAALQALYGQAAAVVAVSGALAARIRRYTGIEARVMSNIIDLSLFEPRREAHEGFVFTAAGTLLPVKGFDTLLAAFARFLQSGADARLLILGDGPERARLEALSRELSLAEHVRFFGRYTRPQFAEALPRCDGFVLASRSETFGVVYAEALACGLPVIATRCGGPEDFIDGRNGLLVPVDDVEALAAAMAHLYESAAGYDAAAISAAARERFSPQRIASELTQVFEQVRAQ